MKTLENEPVIELNSVSSNEIVQKMQLLTEDQNKVDQIRAKLADFAFELIQIYFPDHQAISHYQTLKTNASSKEQLDLGES